MKLRRCNERFMNETLDKDKMYEYSNIVGGLSSYCTELRDNLGDKIDKNYRRIYNKLEDLSKTIMFDYMIKFPSYDESYADDIIERAKEVELELHRIEKVINEIAYDLNAVTRKIESIDI